MTEKFVGLLYCDFDYAPAASLSIMLYGGLAHHKHPARFLNHNYS